MGVLFPLRYHRALADQMPPLERMDFSRQTGRSPGVAMCVYGIRCAGWRSRGRSDLTPINTPDTRANPYIHSPFEWAHSLIERMSPRSIGRRRKGDAKRDGQGFQGSDSPKEANAPTGVAPVRPGPP